MAEEDAHFTRWVVTKVPPELTLQTPERIARFTIALSDARVRTLSIIWLWPIGLGNDSVRFKSNLWWLGVV